MLRLNLFCLSGWPLLAGWHFLNWSIDVPVFQGVLDWKWLSYACDWKYQSSLVNRHGPYVICVCDEEECGFLWPMDKSGINNNLGIRRDCAALSELLLIIGSPHWRSWSLLSSTRRTDLIPVRSGHKKVYLWVGRCASTFLMESCFWLQVSPFKDLVTNVCRGKCPWREYWHCAEYELCAHK